MDFLAHLTTFVAVVDARSFTAAADTLGVPQPVLSRRMKALEQELQGELFDRSRRQIEVTELGLTLLPLARDLLARSKAVVEAVREHQGAVAVMMGVPPDTDTHSLADAVTEAAAAGVNLAIRELPSAVRDQALAAGELSMAVVRVPRDMARIVVPLGLGCREDLPQTRRHGGARLEDLRPLRSTVVEPVTLLVTEEDQFASYLDHLDSAGARAGLAASQIRQVSSTSAAVIDVLAGNSVLLCSQAFASRSRLTWRPLLDSGLARGYELRASSSARVLRASRLVAALTPVMARSLGAEPQAAADPAPRTTAALGARA